jgi:octaprenyl-diphosphate synthase
METAAAISQLRETAHAERAGELPAERLAQVHAMLAADMAWVDRELALAVGEGVTPATDSAKHLLDAGGKRVRPLALMLSAACFGAIPDAARELATAAELVHLATLLHDDVVDDAKERRGKPAARVLWGNAVSVLAGDLLLTHALERTSAVAPGPVLSELFVTLRKLVDGEVVQLRGRTEVDVRQSTYFRIVRDKTAALFVWATRAGARVSGASVAAVDALGEFGLHLGTAFQLIDDLLDYAGDPQATGKALHTDLREGKLTLPLLVAVAREPGLDAAIRGAREGDALAAATLVSAVHRHGACATVRALAHEESRRAVTALRALPESTARDLLAAVATELTARAA